MWFVGLYLIGYVLLVGGAVVTLALTGVLDRVPRAWVVAIVGIALALGVLLAVVSYRPARTPPSSS